MQSKNPSAPVPAARNLPYVFYTHPARLQTKNHIPGSSTGLAANAEGCKPNLTFDLQT